MCDGSLTKKLEGKGRKIPSRRLGPLLSLCCLVLVRACDVRVCGGVDLFVAYFFGFWNTRILYNYPGSRGAPGNKEQNRRGKPARAHPTPKPWTTPERTRRYRPHRQSPERPGERQGARRPIIPAKGARVQPGESERKNQTIKDPPVFLFLVHVTLLHAHRPTPIPYSTSIQTAAII